MHVYAGGEEIITTAEHPFYVAKRGWTEAIGLRAGDVLVSPNGEYVILEKIEHELLESPVKVYNLEVEDFHTYYVGDSGVLVHNMCKLNNVFNSIKEAPNYDSRFIKDNLRKVNVKNKELLNDIWMELIYMYIYKLNFLILNGLENTIIENKIDDFVQDAIDNLNKEHQTEEVEIVSVQVCDIAGENYGVCEICQTWVSDFSLKNPIFEFSNGVKIGGLNCNIK